MTLPMRLTLSSMLVIAGITTLNAALPVAQDEPSGPAELPDVRLVSPVDGAYVTGPTRLHASVDPPGLARRAVFFVDGRQVCVTIAPTLACEWDAGTTIAPHHVRVVVELAAGGRIVKTAHTAGTSYAETVDVDLVQVTVTVTDERGRFVKGLPRSAFQVREDGRPQAISQFSAADAPLELVVAVDMSESMRQSMPQLRRAVASFLAAVPDRHRVTLLGFNDEVFTLARSTTDLHERTTAVDQLTAWGTTALYEGISEGVELLGRRMGRKSLLVFSDGEDLGSRLTIEQVEAELQASDLTLFTIGQGRAMTSVALKRVLERLAQPTGGRALFTAQPESLQDAFTEILDELSSQYVLAYQSDITARTEAWRQIAVRVAGHDRVRARLGYRVGPSK